MVTRQITLVYLCTGSLDFARRPISIESTETLKIVTAVGLCKHIRIKQQSVFEEKCICKRNDTRVIQKVMLCTECYVISNAYPYLVYFTLFRKVSCTKAQFNQSRDLLS